MGEDCGNKSRSRSRERENQEVYCLPKSATPVQESRSKSKGDRWGRRRIQERENQPRPTTTNTTSAIHATTITNEASANFKAIEEQRQQTEAHIDEL